MAYLVVESAFIGWQQSSPDNDEIAAGPARACKDWSNPKAGSVAP